MDEADKTKLLKNFETLLDVNAEEVLPYLVQEGIFTLDEREEILAKTTHVAKITHLLTMLPDQGPNAYSKFKNSIQESYSWVYKALDDTVVESTNSRKLEPITELNHAALNRVARHAKVKSCWKRIGYSLELDQADIIEIEHATRHESLNECVYQTLLLWKRRHGCAATVDKLIFALRSCECNHLADELEGK